MNHEELRQAIQAATPMPVPPSSDVRRGLRSLARLSMPQVAEAVGVKPLTVWRWEHGVLPRGRNLDAYGRLLSACLTAAAPVAEALTAREVLCPACESKGA